MHSLGICVGSSNISVAKLEWSAQEWKFIEGYSRAHEGKTRETFLEILAEHQDIEHIAVTGRAFKNRVKLAVIPEPEAVEIAYQAIRDRYGKLDALVSAGGEIFVAYELDQSGKIANVYTGNKCASGTGEFFLQQIQRMGLDLNQAADIADLEHPHNVAGRCSVFCKSDCTHALNKGEPKSQVVSGLSLMMARKILDLVNKFSAKAVMLIGGTAKNKVMVDFLKQKLETLEVPKEAAFFEAFGAALWAHDQPAINKDEDVLQDQEGSFQTLPRLADYVNRVQFHQMHKGLVNKGDRCILGLDVGSTTTKAVVLRVHDKAVLASVYLRTNGDPIGAAKQCYQQLLTELSAGILIVGLGVTGSGRQIAGLHALTPAVINEIIAHATAAVYFDPTVDTILEIGGQDAKYTLINHRVPADYAMNEACSAGTGSFLEEAARESLDIKTTEIAQMAMQGQAPPNFNDQCAAFISSDIKVATHEGIEISDICAGLVYSVCQNYNNRVKGNRKIGERVFMQGGVCYNQAVPIAMSVLLGKEIVVPPEPGLMGAFGVALETLQRIENGILVEQKFDLRELAERAVTLDRSFICMGGAEKCDRKCSIALYKINGETYPFGGACNKYVNLIKEQDFDVTLHDMVAGREGLITKPMQTIDAPKGRIGLSQALSNYNYTPLFSTFFSQLGWEVVKAKQILPEGIEKQGAAFCYPVEIAHGLFADLSNQELDYLWLPQIRRIETEAKFAGVVCPLAQAEPYFLKESFPELGAKMLSPVLNFTHDWQGVKAEMIRCALQNLGADQLQAEVAWERAYDAQNLAFHQMKSQGQQLLARLAENPDQIAIVLFGRSYNAFTSMANMGIPHKFASRGFTVVPYDYLPFMDEVADETMYWSHGQMIMQATEFVKKHPQLFGVFVTNFSCGPDSFIISYFRHLMDNKPSLTLELDSHTADAGIDTRIEAFLDIIHIYTQVAKPRLTKDNGYQAAEARFENNQLLIYDSNAKPHRLTDPNVQVLIPSMGDFSSNMLAATLRFSGIKATACPAPGELELKLGRANSSCKECLPLQLTIGSLLAHLDRRKTDDELLVYFMPTASGPCRFGQYNVLMKQLMKTQQIPNVAMLSLTAQNGYAGLRPKVMLRAWGAMLIADIFDDVRNTLLALAVDKDQASRELVQFEQRLINAVEHKSWAQVKVELGKIAEKLKEIPLTNEPGLSPRVFITGEIYVRQDEFARQHLVEKLAKRGIIAHVAPIHEWIYYIDYIQYHGHLQGEIGIQKRLGMGVATRVKRNYEQQVRNLLAKSGLIKSDRINIDRYVEYGSRFVSPELTGEAILTIGGTFAEIIDHVSGVLALGPFGCMPNRIAEAIVTKGLRRNKAGLTTDPAFVEKVLAIESALPFLSVETDGNVFPPVIEARFETFCMQVKRLHQSIVDVKREG